MCKKVNIYCRGKCVKCQNIISGILSYRDLCQLIRTSSWLWNNSYLIILCISPHFKTYLFLLYDIHRVCMIILGAWNVIENIQELNYWDLCAYKCDLLLVFDLHQYALNFKIRKNQTMLIIYYLIDIRL